MSPACFCKCPVPVLARVQGNEHQNRKCHGKQDSRLYQNGRENIYSIAVGNSDIIQTGFNDLTAKIYDSSAEALDKSIEAYKRNH